jgi:Sortase domain
MSPLPRPGGPIVYLTLGAGALLLVGWTATLHPGQGGPGSSTPTGPSQGDTDVVEAKPAQRTGAVRAQQPRSVRLPDGVVVPIRAVSTRRDGLLDVPRDIRTAGWWRGGSRLGDPWGSTLVAAHVDSRTQGLGPYAALLDVRRQDRFVLTSDTLRQTFRATSLRLVPQGPLTGKRWLSSPSGARRLVLVTCAPPYVPARGGYQNLAVVTAIPVSAPTPGSR